METVKRVTEEWIAEVRAAMPGALLELVRAQPGLPKTHYIYWPVAEGGLRGLTEDKYAALELLFGRGELELGFSRGRRKDVPGVYPAGHPEAKTTPADTLRAGLVGLVRREPGRAQSYYCRLPFEQHGLPGSQERKERALSALLAEGVLQLRELPRPIRRQRNGVYPAAEAV